MIKLNNIKHIDYKDTELLKKFLDPYSRIVPRGETKISASNQRKIARAIHRARLMGLLPFLSK
ncbi:MAG: 30S ribosomal protein S18 [Candidatus Lloydbacteria bacterium RIFCSPHIGHO2_02_FULL_51_22]|uniref:Small ribosomal subunit protein bS18 n=3 Tax=Candidatus Lloydiibacteriota TaxID=1817910 RepID=A0A1G2DA73_9BACT|nr:MAG: 30S ribosomal protein S18 [Candidatus Lloydbacteria bacterium RIFCSPHIGHO2_02_FULL_51_22]OGZ15627.1 MAG: 30S ribosomal protein S18 [Candidatus Lloydbacteria bacterium RIFCSPLOWO2_02_FULL_51_11]OGZ15983.1 MAG: 30S ribosomal protein S18 [Candidatus Lloydbacteria bacterium RIFCSPLOWO2_12_FULL_51_9]